MGIALIIAGVIAIAAIRIVREYQRVVVFRLGRLRGAHGPGLVLVVPLIDTTRSVSLQVDTADATRSSESSRSWAWRPRTWTSRRR